jgi:hypothetical protein
MVLVMEADCGRGRGGGKARRLPSHAKEVDRRTARRLDATAAGIGRWQRLTHLKARDGRLVHRPIGLAKGGGGPVEGERRAGQRPRPGVGRRPARLTGEEEASWVACTELGNE